MNEAICDLMLSFMHFTLYAVDVGNKLPGPSLSSSIVQSEHIFFPFIIDDYDYNS